MAKQQPALILVLLSTAMAWSQAAESKSKPAEDLRISRNSPEGTLRLFTLGVMLGNEKLIRATMLPVPDKDLAFLVKKPDGLTAAKAKAMKEMCAELKVKSLKVGDKFKLPGGNEIVVKDEEVTEKTKVLVLGDAPIPTRMYKAKNGFWWVDGSPTIAARKAAAKHKKNREAGKVEAASTPSDS